MEQNRGTVDQHPATVEETRAYFESLYNNLAIEVEKVNSVNRKMKETNADLTTELARYKNQEKCFEISQEKYDKLERCYQKSVYQEQCLTKKINALHLSSGKQITTLNEEISNLNKQLSKEKSTVSSLLEEKKRLKSDFKIREDELLDKHILLENKIKELDNILKMALGYQNPFYLKQAQQKQQSLYNGKVLLEKHDPPVVHDSEETLQLAQESQAADFVQDFKSLANKADESLDKQKTLEREFDRLLEAVVSQEIMSIVQDNSVVDTSNLQTELAQAAKFVRDFQSLAKEDESLAKHKALELEIERLLRAVVSQDIMFIVQKLKMANIFGMIGDTKVVKNANMTKISYGDKAYNDMQQKIERLQAQLGDQKGKLPSSSGLKLYSVTPFPKSKGLPKIDESHALSKPVTSNSVPIPQESKVVKNDKVIASGMFRIDPSKTSRKTIFVPKKAKAEVKKPKKVGSKERLASPTSSEPSITRRQDGFHNPTLFSWQKFLGTVRFRNDHVAAIMGFDDLQWGNILITRVYFVEGLGHNLFSVGQFCDSDLEMRQYIAITDHILWDIITNGDQATTYPASSHLLSFHDATNAKTLWTAIKARFGGNEASKKMQKNLLKQQFGDIGNLNVSKKFPPLCVGCSCFNDSGTTGLDEWRMSSRKRFLPVPSHSDEIICSFFAQQASMPTTHDDEDLLQIDEDAMEEIDIRWQLFKLKKALVATDNNEDIDWTKEFDAEPVTYAMMALTEVEQDDWSMEFDAEHVHFGQDGLEVPYCPNVVILIKACVESYQTERDNFQKARTEILGYQMSLESLEVILKTHEKNEYAWGDKYEQMEYDLKIRDLKLEEKQKELDQALKERDELSRYPHQRKSFIPSAVLTREGLKSTAKPKLTRTVPSKSTANVFYQGTARPRVPQAVLSQSTGRPYHPRMDNMRPRTSSFSPSSRSSTTRTPHRPQRPKKIIKSIWVKKGSTVGSHAVLPQNVRVKGVAMINPKQTWRPKGNYLDSVNRDNGSYTSNQWQKISRIMLFIDSGCSGSMTGDKDKLSDFKEFKAWFIAPRKNDVYSLDLKNIIPSGGVTCLVAKANKRKKDETYDMLHDLNCGVRNKLKNKVKTNQVVTMERAIIDVAERKNRTLIEAARTMLADSLLPIQFWAEAVNTACYVLNRVLVTKPQMKTPYEILMGRSPNISFMRPFGCPLTILNTLDHLGKFDGKSDEGYLLGYSTNSKGFRVYNRVTRKVQDCLHVDFLENQENQRGKDLDDQQFIVHGPSINTVQHKHSEELTGNTPTDSVADVQRCVFSKISFDDENTALRKVEAAPDLQANWIPHAVTSTPLHLEIIRFIYKKEPKKTKKSIKALADEKLGLKRCKKSCGMLSIQMQEELLQFKLQEVWVLCDLPEGKRVIGTKWVFRNKRDERGTIIKNKARLVAQGYRQEEGVDYDEVFAPVARIEAIRLFLAFASFMGFIVYQMDVKSAFLYGNITEEVYVKQPPGFEDPAHPNKVYRVVKALYGLHQAPRAWYERLSTFLLKHGYRRGAIDKTLFIKKDRRDIMLVQVYVDDIIFGSTKSSMVKDFEELMQKEFKMSSMGELTFFLGLQVKQSNGGIFLSQDKYVKDILNKFDFRTIKPASTPIEAHKSLGKDEEGEDVDVHLYRSMIGCLMYLTASRPDIMFAVCLCARFQVTPKVSHLHAVKRIFRYLKHQPKLGLWYPKDSPFHLEAFSDSDYAGDNHDRRSTSGGCQYLGRRLVSWQCKKQTIVAISSTEAEYVAAASCCAQVLWMQNQLLDYGFNFMNTEIHIDNESTICIVRNPVFHSKTKHIQIRHHFIRDCYEQRLINVVKVHTDDNVADLLTKGFDLARFNFLVVTIGMINP
ncbi:putative ribonuclease H-like domain-containing protein [Tanacetum coccineum]